LITRDFNSSNNVQVKAKNEGQNLHVLMSHLIGTATGPEMTPTIQKQTHTHTHRERALFLRNITSHAPLK